MSDYDGIAVARAVLNVQRMTVWELVSWLGVTRLTLNTYFYIDVTGAVCAVEKVNRCAYPDDSAVDIGYLALCTPDCLVVDAIHKVAKGEVKPTNEG